MVGQQLQTRPEPDSMRSIGGGGKQGGRVTSHPRQAGDGTGTGTKLASCPEWFSRFTLKWLNINNLDLFFSFQNSSGLKGRKFLWAEMKAVRLLLCSFGGLGNLTSLTDPRYNFWVVLYPLWGKALLTSRNTWLSKSLHVFASSTATWEMSHSHCSALLDLSFGVYWNDYLFFEGQIAKVNFVLSPPNYHLMKQLLRLNVFLLLLFDHTMCILASQQFFIQGHRVTTLRVLQHAATQSVTTSIALLLELGCFDQFCL